MKSTYETRIQALETRLQAAETKTADAAPKVDNAAPQGETAQAASNSFNPEISLILQGGYAHLKDLPERRITGFLPDGTPDSASRGFSVDDSELVLSANIDPYFRGYFNAVLNDDTVG